MKDSRVIWLGGAIVLAPHLPTPAAVVAAATMWVAFFAMDRDGE